MSATKTKRTTELTAFDDAGVFIGSAQLSLGTWSVVARRNVVASAVTRCEAEKLLRMYGAVKIEEGQGVEW